MDHAISASPKCYAYYSDGISWESSDWAKSMLLFFDGIAVLVPEREDEAFEHSDEAVIAGMRKAECLRVLRPTDLVDAQTAGDIASDVEKIVAALDWRGGEDRATDSLYVEKLGSHVAGRTVDRLASNLRDRGLAKGKGAALEVDRRVIMLVLSVIAAHAQRRGQALGVQLTPAHSTRSWAHRREFLGEWVRRDQYAHIINTDVETLRINVGPIPVDELVSFREQNRSALDQYRLAIALLAKDLAQLDLDLQRVARSERVESLKEARREIERSGREYLSNTGGLMCAVAGLVWTCIGHDIAGALLAGGVLAFDALGTSSQKRLHDLSYVISASQVFQ